MNLSRRSVGLSALLHCSLVAGGYFWWLQGSHHRGLIRQEGARSVTVVSRPVTVKPQSRPLAEKTPELVGTGSRRATSSPPAEATHRVQTAAPSQSLPGPPVVADTPVSPQLSSGSVYPKASSSVRPSAVPRPVKKRAAVTIAPTPSLSPAGWGTPQLREKPSPAGEDGPQSAVTRRAMPVSQPEFRLHERFPQLASVTVKAQFKVAPDGTYEPTLLTSSGDATADVVILGKLLDFTWLPAMKKGVPYEDTRVLDISLEL